MAMAAVLRGCISHRYLGAGLVQFHFQLKKHGTRVGKQMGGEILGTYLSLRVW